MSTTEVIMIKDNKSSDNVLTAELYDHTIVLNCTYQGADLSKSKDQCDFTVAFTITDHLVIVLQVNKLVHNQDIRIQRYFTNYASAQKATKSVLHELSTKQTFNHIQNRSDFKNMIISHIGIFANILNTQRLNNRLATRLND